MALATDVQNRIATQQLINWTNQNDADATTVDTTYLGYAVLATASYFKRWCQVVYDDTNADHTDIAVLICTAFLKDWSGQIEKKTWEHVKEQAKQFAATGPRARVTPKTSGEYTPSDQKKSADQVVRPPFDWPVWDDIIPGEPGLADD